MITGGGLKQVNLGKIEAIGFRNILDLASHGMSRADAFTMHLFGFKNGSTVEITSSDSGRIENFTALGVHMDIEDIGGGSRRLMISMLAGWKPDSPA